MRTFAIAALLGTVSAVKFNAGDAPKCSVNANGITVVQYTTALHPSFKCAHDGGECSCTLTHPSHHKGGCRQFDHAGVTHNLHGDCSDAGRNECTCANGAAAVATCDTHNAAKCASCSSGYFLSNDACSLKQCGCSNGTGASGTSCPANGNSKCVSCDAGYDLVNNACRLPRKPVRALTLQRFHYGKSVGHGSHNAAHMAEEAFCATVGGRLPTYQELCPNYNRNAATAPKLGCENSHSWMPYKGNQNNWMYVGCPGTGHHQCKDHVSHHGNPGWGSGDQYGVMLDCMAPKMKLQRFHYGKSVGHGSHNAAHNAEEAFCAAKGGRLPTLNELCPSYSSSSATAPKLGCENSHSWMPYKGNQNNWMYVGCPGTGHHECKDHVTHHGNPGWGSGDQYGDKLDCMVPDV